MDGNSWTRKTLARQLQRISYIDRLLAWHIQADVLKNTSNTGNWKIHASIPEDKPYTSDFESAQAVFDKGYLCDPNQKSLKKKRGELIVAWWGNIMR